MKDDCVLTLQPDMLTLATQSSAFGRVASGQADGQVVYGQVVWFIGQRRTDSVEYEAIRNNSRALLIDLRR